MLQDMHTHAYTHVIGHAYTHVIGRACTCRRTCTHTCHRTRIHTHHIHTHTHIICTCIHMSQDTHTRAHIICTCTWEAILRPLSEPGESSLSRSAFSTYNSVRNLGLRISIFFSNFYEFLWTFPLAAPTIGSGIPIGI